MPFGLDDAAAIAHVLGGVQDAVGAVKDILTVGNVALKGSGGNASVKKEGAWVLNAENEEGEQVRGRANVSFFLDSGHLTTLSGTIIFTCHVRHYGIRATRSAACISYEAKLGQLFGEITNFNELDEALRQHDIMDDDKERGLWNAVCDNSQHFAPLTWGGEKVWGIQSLKFAWKAGGSTDHGGNAVSRNNPYRAFGDGNEATLSLSAAMKGTDLSGVVVQGHATFPSNVVFGATFPQLNTEEPVMKITLTGDAPAVDTAGIGKHWAVVED